MAKIPHAWNIPHIHSLSRLKPISLVPWAHECLSRSYLDRWSVSTQQYVCSCLRTILGNIVLADQSMEIIIIWLGTSIEVVHIIFCTVLFVCNHLCPDAVPLFGINHVLSLNNTLAIQAISLSGTDEFAYHCGPFQSFACGPFQSFVILFGFCMPDVPAWPSSSSYSTGDSS